MKIFTLLTLISLNSYAALPVMKCITDGMPTTSFLVEPKNETVEVRVVNHNGIKYAPLYGGLMTLSTIDYVKRSGDFFSKLGTDFTVVFQKEKCKFEENKFYTCSRPEKFEVNKTAVEAAYFYTSESVDKIPDMEFTRKNVRINFRTAEEDYTLEMHYYDYDASSGDCKFEISKK